MASIREQKLGAVTVLTMQGPLILEDAQTLCDMTMQSVGPSLGRIALDLSDAPYVDSAGLETLLTVAEHLSTMGQTLRLTGVVGTVREVLEITGLSQWFEYHEDVTSAIRSYL